MSYVAHISSIVCVISLSWGQRAGMDRSASSELWDGVFVVLAPANRATRRAVPGCVLMIKWGEGFTLCTLAFIASWQDDFTLHFTLCQNWFHCLQLARHAATVILNSRDNQDNVTEAATTFAENLPPLLISRQQLVSPACQWTLQKRGKSSSSTYFASSAFKKLQLRQFWKSCPCDVTKGCGNSPKTSSLSLALWDCPLPKKRRKKNLISGDVLISSLVIKCLKCSRLLQWGPLIIEKQNLDNWL